MTGRAAEEARALVAGANVAALATLSEDGGPWSSLVMYAALEDGTPVLCLSTLAEHGRNLARDPRASLVIADGAGGDTRTTGAADEARPADPLDRARVTLAGRVEAPVSAELDAARAAYAAAAPASRAYGEFGDFTYYLLRIERVRWVGGYGRMDSVTAADYHAAEPRPGARGT